MKMRMLMYGQVIWLSVVAMLFGGLIKPPSSVLDRFPHWCNTLVSLLLLLPAYLFPVLVIVAARHLRYARARMTLVVALELLFFFTWVVASLPAVQ